MSDIVQLYSDKTKTTKAYPKTLASETYMSNGGTVESQLAQIENKNIDQDIRLKEVDRVNKTQQVYINGLFNENKDGRLSVEGEGNILKLEGSKEGLVEVEKTVGNTLVNIHPTQTYNFNYNTSVDSALVTISNGLNYVKVEFSSTLTSWSCIALGLLNMNMIKPNTKYSIIFKKSIGIKTVRFDNSSATAKISSESTINNNVAVVTTTDFINLGVDVSKIILYGAIDRDTCLKIDVEDAIILEGDYTNKPIPSEVFEGLQSSFEENLVTEEMVTQGLENAENLGKYKVPVKVVGKNLFDGKWEIGTIGLDGSSVENANAIRSGYIKVKPNNPYVYNSLVNGQSIFFYDKFFAKIGSHVITNIFTTPPNCCYIRFRLITNDKDIKVQIEEGTIATDREDYFERTTNVYLNSPLLEGDEIVMKDGELCHYHRYVKEVLDGTIIPFFVKDINSDIAMYGINLTSKATSSIFNVINDKFIVGLSDESGSELLRIGNAGNSIFIAITNSKLSTADKYGVQQWLQSNHVIVVYELAEPYYEPISSDKLLLECANDSTIHLDTVVPVESVSASYTGNVPSVYALEETNNNQDSLIDISLCATDEMYTMIEPLLSAVPQTLNNERMISKMVDMYVAMVIRGLKTIEEVPVRYRKEVQAMLDKLEK